MSVMKDFMWLKQTAKKKPKNWRNKNMKVEREKIMVEQTVIKYIANDGREFLREEDCERYEKKLWRDMKIREAEKLRIRKLDGVVPITRGLEVNEDNGFIWYKVNCEADFKIIVEAYDNRYNDFLSSATYPNILCVESNGFLRYTGDACGYWLDEMRSATETFWTSLGYRVTLEKENNILD